MRQVEVTASESYTVHIGKNILDTLGDKLGFLKGRSAMIVSDDNVFPLYGQRVKASLEAGGIKTDTFVFPHGERSKNLTVYGRLLENMCSSGFGRKDCIVALGGGVTGDLAGFAAATYQRGMGFVQIPTTLLAAVDSSVGGKTAVDLESGKNQVGAFYQPKTVVCDCETLDTLPEEEYRNGCAEIIKYAVLDSARLFDDITEKPVSEQYEDVIARCVEMKSRYVSEDEFDNGVRMKLNLGHTLAHAIEAVSDFQIPHGSAVATGLCVISRAAAELGYCDGDTAEKIVSLVSSYDLPTQTDYPIDLLQKASLSDKKRQGGKMTVVVPRMIGKCDLIEIGAADFSLWLRAGGVK